MPPGSITSQRDAIWAAKSQCGALGSAISHLPVPGDHAGGWHCRRLALATSTNQALPISSEEAGLPTDNVVWPL